MTKKKKYYSVWKGKKTGVFDNWTETQSAVSGFSGAEYKSFLTKEEALKAFGESYEKYKGLDTTGQALSASEKASYGKPDANSICVDAACSSNPGILEFRGVDLATKKELFRYGPFDDATTNVGEFLALVCGAKLIVEKPSHQKKTLYSDSKIALGRLQKGKCRTQLQPTSKNAHIFQQIEKAEERLARHDVSKLPIKKWHTKAWGEIPADFGRK